jgi:uncharacterized protein (DUF924 family)
LDFAQADFLTVQGGGTDGSGTSLSTSLKDLQKLGANAVMFDHPLSGVQGRNLVEEFKVRVLDRNQVIVDIFAQRAKTYEGKLQVELAQMLDQLPRNLHRGSAEAFAQDAKARDLARTAVLARGFDRALPPAAATFLYLPFEHSEALADQNLAVALFEGLRDVPSMAAPGGAIDYAWRHRAVILRFGRFPHRNAALGRASTPAEEAWLAAGGGF